MSELGAMGFADARCGQTAGCIRGPHLEGTPCTVMPQRGDAVRISPRRGPGVTVEVVAAKDNEDGTWTLETKPVEPAARSTAICETCGCTAKADGSCPWCS